MTAWWFLRGVSGAVAVSALVSMATGEPFDGALVVSLGVVAVWAWFRICSTLKDRT
jgi:hypothetical protein